MASERPLRLFRPGETDANPELFLTWFRKRDGAIMPPLDEPYATFKEAMQALYDAIDERLEDYRLAVCRKATVPHEIAFDAETAREVAWDLLNDWYHFHAFERHIIAGMDFYAGEATNNARAVEEFRSALIPWLKRWGPRCFTGMKKLAGEIDLTGVDADDSSTWR